MVVQAEQTFDCCGLGINETSNEIYLKPNKHDQDFTLEHEVFKNYPDAKCFHTGEKVKTECETCYSHITDKVGKFWMEIGVLTLFPLYSDTGYCNGLF